MVKPLEYPSGGGLPGWIDLDRGPLSHLRLEDMLTIEEELRVKHSALY